MDFLEDYAPQAFNFYHNYYKPYSTYVRPLQRYILLAQSYFYSHFFPYLYPIVRLTSSALQSLLTDTPSIFTLAVLAMVLIVSLKLLDMLRRTIIYWISVAIRLALWASIAGLGIYMYNRGVEQTVEDIGWVMGMFEGLGNEGQRVGQRRAAARDGKAQNLGKRTARGRTRGAGW
ncbi:MAG: hypothetical protein Q9191_004905 [Dirinaria sp. TL-2023a]